MKPKPPPPLAPALSPAAKDAFVSGTAPAAPQHDTPPEKGQGSVTEPAAPAAPPAPAIVRKRISFDVDEELYRWAKAQCTLSNDKQIGKLCTQLIEDGLKKMFPR